MKFLDFPSHPDSTYIIIRNTGYGVMEGPYEEHDIVYGCNTMEEAETMSNELEILNNHQQAIDCALIPNTYHIHINTLTTQGKELLINVFTRKFENTLNKLKSSGTAKEVKVGDITVWYEPLEAFNDSPPQTITDPSNIAWSVINTNNNDVCLKCNVAQGDIKGCEIHQDCPYWRLRPKRKDK